MGREVAPVVREGVVREAVETEAATGAVERAAGKVEEARVVVGRGTWEAKAVGKETGAAVATVRGTGEA